MPSPLHQQRLDYVVQHLLDSGAHTVLDLGCGPGELLQRLLPHPQFTAIVGLDIDVRVLAVARAMLGLGLPAPRDRVQLRHGSFEDDHADLEGFDAAALIETIEHIDPGRLSRLERTVFARLRPRTVIVTTPNRDYNVLHGMAPEQRRHPGHRFEWTRAQFQSWASGVALRNGYAVEFFDVGSPDRLRGASTQLARLRLDPQYHPG